jgi:hypothetical protein
MICTLPSKSLGTVDTVSKGTLEIAREVVIFAWAWDRRKNAKQEFFLRYGDSGHGVMILSFYFSLR